MSGSPFLPSFLSIVCHLAFSPRLRIVEPVHVVDQFVGLGSKRDRLDVQVCEALVGWVDDEGLRFEGHELGRQPRAEHLPIERLPRFQMVVIVRIFEINNGCVGFDLANVEEHLVDFFVGVGVRATQIVTLPNGFLHFEAVGDGKGHICDINRLHLVGHPLNLPIHSVEHLHLHAPLR